VSLYQGREIPNRCMHERRVLALRPRCSSLATGYWVLGGWVVWRMSWFLC